MTKTNIVPQDAPTLASDAELAAHAADTTAIHGIADTAALATSTDLSTHAADATAVHGITDTAALVVDGDAAAGELSGTYPNPTVAASHGGGTHAATQAAAEATAAAALTGHTGDTTDAHDASAVSFVPAGGIAAADVQAAIEELDTEKSGTAHTHTHASTTGQGIDDHHPRDHAINGATHTGTLDDAQIPAGVARDAEVAAAYQPLDSDLTAIAALATTAFGRGLLALADAAALAANHAHLGGAYAAGTFSVATGNYVQMVKRLQLTTTQRVTLAGTARLRIH